jgi:dTDP-4-dehydrorhamnose 3,5-epimerase
VIFTETQVLGCYQVDLERRVDPRGFFARVWCAGEFRALGLSTHVEQANVSFNERAGTLRGLHLQRPPHQEAKLIRCIRGSIWDVCLDVRPDSPSYGKWVGAELNASNGRALYVPEGCAHGYQTLVDESEVFYLASCGFAPSHEAGVRWDDPAFAIEWPRAEGRTLSEKDAAWPDWERS